MVWRAGSLMKDHELGPIDKSRELCHQLISTDFATLQDSLFSDHVFKFTIDNMQNRNKSRANGDISLLISPSAEQLAPFSATHLRILIESVEEGWSSPIIPNLPYPQPDYSVGFRREAFTSKQVKKLDFLVGYADDVRWLTPHFTGNLV
jgi:hypothetical protein